MEVDFKKLAEIVKHLAEPALRANDLALVDVEVKPLKRRLLVRVVVDRPGGVMVDDCARMSRQLSDLLDVHDPIHSSYTLEVSSPGLNRPLKKKADYAWAVGRRIRVTTTKPKDGRNVFVGRLADLDAEVVILETDDGAVRLKLEEVAKARLDFEPFKQT